MPGVDPFRRQKPGRLLVLFAVFALPFVAAGEREPPPAGLAQVRNIERYAGQLIDAAAELEALAAQVHADGRLHSLQRLRDRQADVQRSVRDVTRTLEALEEVLEAVELSER